MNTEFWLAAAVFLLLLAVVLFFRSDRIPPNHLFIFKLLEGWSGTPLSESGPEEETAQEPPPAHGPPGSSS